MLGLGFLRVGGRVRVGVRVGVRVRIRASAPPRTAASWWLDRSTPYAPVVRVGLRVRVKVGW